MNIGNVLNLSERDCDTGMSWRGLVTIPKIVFEWRMDSFRSLLDIGRCSALSMILRTLTMCCATLLSFSCRGAEDKRGRTTT